MTPNIADIIRNHTSLNVRCLGRLYSHAYLPKPQTSGGLCYFFHDHLCHHPAARGRARGVAPRLAETLAQEG
jgi:hypothetical protein